MEDLDINSAATHIKPIHRQRPIPQWIANPSLVLMLGHGRGVH